jgi:hypothetical protein
VPFEGISRAFRRLASISGSKSAVYEDEKTVRPFCITDIAGAFLKCFCPLNSMTHTRYDQDACYDQQISEQHCPAERLVEKKDRAGTYQRIRHRSNWEGQ